MVSSFYGFLVNLGYSHPLHPILTHLPVGLTIAGFIFTVLSYFFKHAGFEQSATHCIVLAFLMAIPTVVTGYLDWQYFYRGTFLFPIKMKLALATLLLFILLVIVIKSRKIRKGVIPLMSLHVISLFVVIGIGYYGGELVYGKRSIPSQPVLKNEAKAKSILTGEKIFTNQCSFCHFSESADTKVGPGLKGLFQRDTMPVSGWPVSIESVQRQLKIPYSQMPVFDQFTDEEVMALMDYIKTL